MKITKAFLISLQKNPTKILNDLSDDDIASILQKANYEYYNGDKPIFSDDMFDLIKEYLENRNPKHPILKNIGAAVADDERKVKLPYFLASLDKIKSDEKELDKWTRKHPGNCVVSDKLDGVSALFIVKNKKAKLYTRGDGEVGQDISHLIPFIQNIPMSIRDTDIAVRGELIISKKDFNSLTERAANARNLVSGLVNAKIPDLDVLKYVQFVVYELIVPNKIPSEGLVYMHELGFKIVVFKLLESISMENLSDILINRRKNSEFEMDGIVIMHDKIYKRVKGNPSYGFAFKSVHTMESVEVVVSGVEWNISKDGYMKPVVLFPKVKLTGVTIQRATGFNAKYISDNKIGPGSRVTIIRSGDVIPYISNVISPSANGEPDMPSITYIWSSTHVDIMASKEVSTVNDEFAFKQLEHFTKTIGVKGLSTGTIRKLFDDGMRTVKDILYVKKERLLRVPGIKDKTAENIINALEESKKNMDCLTIMTASNVFGRGFGNKKLNLITSIYKSRIQKRASISYDELIAIRGIEKTSAEQFLSNYDNFWKFIDDNDIQCIFDSESVNHTNEADIDIPYNNNKTLENHKVVFTGFRDSDLEKKIKELGGDVTTTVSKNTTIVVKKDGEKDSGKITKARELGIRIMTYTEFTTEFINQTDTSVSKPISKYNIQTKQPESIIHDIKDKDVSAKEAIKVPEKDTAKECPEGKILNPKTNRCINDTIKNRDKIKNDIKGKEKEEQQTQLKKSLKKCPSKEEFENFKKNYP